ncbi:MAG: tetratricopeptide repeat protein [Candidatus Neomarinimicrobiota bacterium]
MGTGCAYFNTFYNARQYFDTAEEKRLQKVGEKVPAGALEDYGKVIAKSKRVLEKYPDSKYRLEAILLMGISHYHRGEVRKAEITFKSLSEVDDRDHQWEAQFWQALCKWRLGKSQPALDDLNNLLKADLRDDFKARIYLAQADILLEEGLRSEAFGFLEKAAELTHDSNERSQIYYQIASLAFNNSDYEAAYRANKQVLKNTISKSRINDTNLQIVRIYRLQKKYNNLESEVKSLLADEQYKDIHAALLLELGKAYYDRQQLADAREQLELVSRGYRKTEAAAESLYLLGKIRLFKYHELDSAKILFDRASKENNKSPIRTPAQDYFRKIGTYTTIKVQLAGQFEQLNQFQSPAEDTVIVDSSTRGQVAASDSLKLANTIAGNIYKLAEYEIFSFDCPDSGISYLVTIINYYPGTDYYPQALFTLSRLYERQGRNQLATELKNGLISEFPESEYAAFYLSGGKNNLKNPEQELLLTGESLWKEKPESALTTYKKIIRTVATSETAAQAAFFLAFHYDHTFNAIDSAYAYYDWLNTNHPDSEQAQASKKRRQILKTLVEPITTVPAVGDTIIASD